MLLRTIQTGGWIAFLGYAVFSGAAFAYVIDWQVWLLIGSLAVLILGMIGRHWDNHAGHDHSGHDHSSHDHSGHDHEPPTIGETGVHFLPLILLVVIGQTVLGTHSLGSAPGILIAPRPASTDVIITDADGYRQTDLLALRHDPYLAGGKIMLTARLGELAEQTTRRRRKGPEPEPKPVLFRHVISCCAADGRPIYAWLADDSPIDLPLDSWITIRGTVNERETGGVVPIIHVDSWNTIPVPKEPYLVLPGATPQHPIPAP